MKGVKKKDLAILKEMLGIRENNHGNWGYRNRYVPAPRDHETMERLERMERIGLVRSGVMYLGVCSYHATEKGCRAVGMNDKQIEHALSD